MLRDIRLTALQESPTTFGSTYQRELGFDDATWRDRTRTAVVLLANGRRSARRRSSARRTNPISAS